VREEKDEIAVDMFEPFFCTWRDTVNRILEVLLDAPAWKRETIGQKSGESTAEIRFDH
jgi:hypothetical protein